MNCLSPSTKSSVFASSTASAPGHPEYRLTTGVETTTGPLGQGLANSVGMAVAGLWLAAHYNKPGFDMFDFNVYAICGDGCMMEGISSEAASFAGHYKLSNLCWIYDNNRITIEGHTSWPSAKTWPSVSTAYGWNVTRVSDANNLEHARASLSCLPEHQGRPTLIIVDSHIAWGVTSQAGHQGGPRRAAGRGGDSADEAQLRLARRRQVPHSRRRLRSFQERHRQTGPGAAAGMGGQVRPV